MEGLTNRHGHLGTRKQLYFCSAKRRRLAKKKKKEPEPEPEPAVVIPEDYFSGYLAPGATLTNFTKRHLKNADGSTNPERYEGFLTAMKKTSPLALVGEAVDQAWLVLYLASDASRFCTGQIWRANGGAAIPH